MRSLFHFPLPAQPPSQQPSPTATVSLQSEMCHRPHPAPMRRQRRSPALLSAARPLPRSRAYLDPAHGPLSPAPRAPAMPRPHPCLAPPPAPIAPHHLSTAPLLPAPPRPHRAHRVPPSASLYVATEQIPRSSPPPITTIVRRRRLTRVALRRPHRAHRAPTSASPPPSLSSRCGGPRALAGKNRAVCIPFSPNARKRPPSWQHPPEMHALRDQNGNILAPCIHSRAQSGDSGYMARESCRQGPFSASRNPKSRMARRCCQRRAAFPRQRPAVRPNGPCAMRQRHAARGMAERALRPAARAWPACRMRAPCHLACARRGLRPLPSRPRSSPPSYMRRASPSETRHAVPVPMHLAICAPHPSRQPRGPTASRKQAEQHKQLNAGIKIGSPNRDPIEELFGFAQRLPDALQLLHQANELALSYLDHSTRQRLGGYVIGLSGNSFTVDLYAALVDHATSIAR